MEAIILAGGFGTRLQSVVKDVPKPMAEINNYPFLKYILDYLSDNGIKRVILSVGYKKEIIEEYFKDSYQNMDILYSKEDEPLGTGGAIKKAIGLSSDDNIFVLNGDTFFDINLNNLYQKHLNSNSDITLSLKKMYNFDRYGKVLIEDDYIKEFCEKEYTKEGFINGGVYVVKKNSITIDEEKFSFEKDILENKSNNLKLSYCKSDGYFIDIGIPQDYQRAMYDFGDNKALFLDRDGIINKDLGYVYKIEDFEFVDKIFDLCKFFIYRGYKVFVITNQAGIAKGYYSENDFHNLTKWMLEEFNNNGIHIEEVFYCPHHPTDGKGDYLKNCECRKPNPQMLLDAQSKYFISLKKSIFIGDKKSDIDAGIRAGVSDLILIKSSYQKEYDFETIKDYINYLQREKI